MYLADAADPAATATINAAWIALAGGLAGVVLTLLGALIGAIIQGRREHRKWIRDQRLRAYVDALAAIDNYLRAAQHDQDNSEFSAVTTDAIRSLSIVQLVGPDRVSASADAYQAAAKASVRQLVLGNDPRELDRLEDDRLAKRRAFIAAARRQVKIER